MLLKRAVTSDVLIVSNGVTSAFITSAIFQLYHGEDKLIFNEMMMRSALY